jgi:hypothetical protein
VPLCHLDQRVGEISRSNSKAASAPTPDGFAFVPRPYRFLGRHPLGLASLLVSMIGLCRGAKLSAHCFTFRAAFFTGAGLGLAFATVRFAVLATLRALLRLAEFPLRSFARFCTFDPFLRDRRSRHHPPLIAVARNRARYGVGGDRRQWVPLSRALWHVALRLG